MICYFQIEQKWQASWPRHVELLVTSLSKKSNRNYLIYKFSFFHTHTCDKVLLQAPHPVGDVARAEPRRGRHLCVWKDFRRRRFGADSEIHIFHRENRENLGKNPKKRGNVEESTSKTSQKYLKVIKRTGKRVAIVALVEIPLAGMS